MPQTTAAELQKVMSLPWLAVTSLAGNLTSPVGNMTAEGSTATPGVWVTDRVFPYLQTSPTMATIYLVVMGTMIASGVLGNILIIGAYWINKNLRTVGNEFIINLALADICVTGIADPMCILGVSHGKEWFAKRPYLCEVVACLCLSACFCAFLSLSMMTLNRYIYVCHNQTYHRIFTKRIIQLLCVGVWVTAFLLEMPNFIGWGGHYFDHKNMQCIWNRKASLSYTLFVTVILILGPLSLMSLAYARIFFRIWASKKKIASHAGGNMTQKEIKKREWRETLRSARSIFVVLCAFLICWLPYTLLVIIDFKDHAPIWMHLWATLLAHMHSSVNVFIYGVTNPHFLDGYWRFLRLDVCFGDRPYQLATWSSQSSESNKNVTQSTHIVKSYTNQVLPGSLTKGN